MLEGQLKHHAIITGTGRSGTTFLVKLLTELGLNTGFSTNNIENLIDQVSNAGLENDVRNPNSPYIVKSPWFCDYAHEVIDNKNIVIDHIFVPVRDLIAAAESRRHVSKTNLIKLNKGTSELKADSFPGGLWFTSSANEGEQEIILMQQLYKLLLAVSEAHTPITLIKYPKLSTSPKYLYSKLRPILNNIEYKDFEICFKKVVRPELVHQFTENDK